MVRREARAAVMKAAKFIEKNPERYNFFYGDKPAARGKQPACALGWIGYFLGVKRRDWFYLDGVAERIGLGDGQHAFYDRMDRLSRGSWTSAASVCAKTLRRYATKYLGPERRKAKAS